MTYEVREYAKITKAVMLTSVFAWIVLLGPGGDVLMLHHHAGPYLSMPSSTSSHPVRAWLPGVSQVLGWAVMLVAMMSPMLIGPICHLRLRSLRCRQVRSVALFLIAYGTAWMVAGYLLLAAAAAITNFFSGLYLPATMVVSMGFLWQFSPAKQLCLNGCHRYSYLAAFGSAADVNALHYGVTHATWCIGSCWLWMLCPLLLPYGHLIAMVAGTTVLFSERLESPMSPSWCVRGPGKGLRLLNAQAGIYLRAKWPSTALFSHR